MYASWKPPIPAILNLQRNTEEEGIVKELFRNKEIPYKMAGENQITLDVKSPFNTMLSCLNNIQVLKDEQKVTDYEDGGIKIGLDRSQQQMLSVIYRMRGGTKTLERKLIVPRAGNDIERF